MEQNDSKDSEMAYDTTVQETIRPPVSRTGEKEYEVPRPTPSSEYFPETTRAGLIAVVVMCVIFVLTSFNRLNHTDLWGHLSFGRWIAQNSALPTDDPFGAASAPDKFTNYYWLGQLGGYSVHSNFGTEGLVMGHVLLIVLSCGMVMLGIRLRNTSMNWAVIGAVVSYVIALPVIGTIRPQLFGTALFPVVLVACIELSRRWHPMVWLPLLFAIWANLHGTFSFGLATLGIYCVGFTWEVFREAGSVDATKDDPRIKRIWLVLALSIVAVCINPNGVNLLINVASFGGHTALAGISEWRPLVLKSFTGVLFYGSVLVTAFLIRFSPRRFRAYEVLLLIFFGLVALTAIRMISWWALVWPVIMAPHAMAAWHEFMKRFEDYEPEPDEYSPMRTILAMGTVFMTILIAPPSNNLISSHPRAIGAVTTSDTPIYVAEEIKNRDIKARIFTPMDWGDYLIWHTDGTIKPLIYSHVHLIESQTWNDYVAVSEGKQDWLRIADAHELEYLVISRRRNPNLLMAVNREPRARIVYQDQQALLVQLLPADDQSPAEEADDTVESDNDGE